MEEQTTISLFKQNIQCLNTLPIDICNVLTRNVIQVQFQFGGLADVNRWGGIVFKNFVFQYN